jgi:hypothetical protein
MMNLPHAWHRQRSHDLTLSPQLVGFHPIDAVFGRENDCINVNSCFRRGLRS